MEDGLAWKGGADVDDAELVDEELAQFEGFLRERSGGRLDGGLCEESWVEDFLHGRTRSGRADDGVEGVLLEDVDLPSSDFGGLGPITGVEGRLATTCLIARVDDVDAKPVEELDRRDSHLGRNLVDIARNQEPDAHEKYPRNVAGIMLQLGGGFGSGVILARFDGLTRRQNWQRWACFKIGHPCP
jgi:hypothetical protein